MSTKDLLLTMKREDFKKAERNIEIKRLSNADNKFMLKVKELSDKQITEIKERCKKDGTINTKEFGLQVILQATIDPNFKDDELIKHYSVATPYDLIKLVLNMGERESVIDYIMSLSGYGESIEIEEAKN